MALLYFTFANHQIGHHDTSERAVSLVIADCHFLIFLRGLCGYVWVHSLTFYHPELKNRKYIKKILDILNVL